MTFRVFIEDLRSSIRGSDGEMLRALQRATQ